MQNKHIGTYKPKLAKKLASLTIGFPFHSRENFPSQPVGLIEG